MYLLAEWGKGEPSHLEMLLTERYADDSDAEQEAEDNVAEP